MPAKRRPRRGSTGPDVVFWLREFLANVHLLDNLSSV